MKFAQTGYRHILKTDPTLILKPNPTKTHPDPQPVLYMYKVKDPTPITLPGFGPGAQAPSFSINPTGEK